MRHEDHRPPQACILLPLLASKQAADFLRISESEFKRMAPRLPRHAVTEWRYIYLRSKLLAWLLGRWRRRVASSDSSRKVACRRTTRCGVVLDRCRRGRRRPGRRSSSARWFSSRGLFAPVCCAGTALVGPVRDGEPERRGTEWLAGVSEGVDQDAYAGGRAPQEGGVTEVAETYPLFCES
jgi:hypothetical protein